MENDSNSKSSAWFDQFDDDEPYDAFGSTENQHKIGEDIFGGIQRQLRRRKQHFFLRIAASILIVTGVAILTGRSLNKPASEKELAWITYHSKAGQYREVKLADGSVIAMRPGTALSAPGKFTDQIRTVKLLEGEAFFRVNHDEQHSFVVQAAGISTRVLGTSFVISNYKNSKAIAVSLITGKVAVNEKQKLLGLLRPLQQMTYDKSDHKYRIDPIDPNWLAAWRTGEYILNDVRIEELAATLKNVYGITVTLRSQDLQQLRITLQFNKKDRIENILEQLKLIHGIKYRINGKEVVLMD
jgi:transmembrane sensor